MPTQLICDSKAMAAIVLNCVFNYVDGNLDQIVRGDTLSTHETLAAANSVLLPTSKVQETPMALSMAVTTWSLLWITKTLEKWPSVCKEGTMKSFNDSLLNQGNKA